VQQKKAIFSDIDKTLIPSGSLNLLVQHLYKKKLIPLNLIIRVLYWYLLYKMNWIKDFSKVIEKSSELLAPLLKSHSAVELNTLINNWFDSDIKQIIYPDIEQRIRDLHKQGYELYFVTSTLEPIAKCFQEYFGFGTVVATELTEKNGYYSAIPNGAPCHGKEKARRMNDLVIKDKLDLANSFAFSDHISDVPMLKLVGHPVVINPNPILNIIARKNKWEILSPKLA